MRGLAWAGIAVLLVTALLGSLLLGSREVHTAACGTGAAVVADAVTASDRTAVAGYSGGQLQNAALIVNAGAQAGIDQHGQTIAVMVAAGESGLRALTYGDTAGPDSRGLFQQRASWGTLAERLDPTRAAHLFYARLTTITGWQQMTPTAAAHAVQGNADPGYYSRYWAPATAIVTALTGDDASTTSSADTACTGPVGGDPQALAAQLVTAIDAGTITGLVPDHLREIRWIADGRTVPDCGIDTRILQIITIAHDTFHRIGISDINRYCTGQILGAGTASSHWIHGGGQAVDFYSLAGIPTTGADTNALHLIRALDPVAPTGTRVGQAGCRIRAHDAPALTHLVPFDDTCNHLHLDVAYTDGALDLPDTVNAATTVARSGTSSGSIGAAGSGRATFSDGTALRSAIRSSTPGRLAIPAGTWTLNDFQANFHGADLPNAGLQGAGSGQTIIAMTPHSSTRAGDVPTRPFTTNPLNLLTTTGGSPQLGGFTLQATDQDHLYNGLRVGQARGLRASDIAVTGVPGNANYPPGETFAINDWRTIGSVWTRLNIDGAGIGATGFGANSSRDLTIRDSSFTGLKWSAGLALWQTTGITLDHITVIGNRAGINLERASGNIVIRGSTFANNDKYDLQFMTDQAGGEVTIVDPVLAPGQQLRLHVPGRYQGQSNGQDRSRIRVLIDGVDRTSTVIDWV